jgi:predicted transcriptional regulator
MSHLLRQFEADCQAARITPPRVLRHAKVHPSLWWKWKEGKVSPTLKSFERVCDALSEMKAANDDAASERAA